MGLGCQTITWGGVVGTALGIVSVKDAWIITHGSDEQAIRDIAAVGYDGFEIFDGNLQRYVDDPEPMQGWMKETGLQLVGVYTSANFIYNDCLEDEFWRIERAADSAQQFQAPFLIAGGGAIRASGVRAGDFEVLARGLDRCAALAARRGLQAVYHPHLGSMVESPEDLEKLTKLSDIALCPDTAHVVAGGGDPVQMIHQYRDRIKYVHFKDYADGTFLPLGEGTVDLAGVVEALRGTDAARWWTTELDEAGNRGPAALAAKSLRVLQNLRTRGQLAAPRT
ncbi:MAG: sugar phosphate isomerase/epimerase family protein [Chloroflexota bacterium]|nr:MAG: sugar phosphate isomerase [Chloroflexota bacterium]